MATFEDGPFKNQENSNSNWLPTSRSQIPDPRPGLCYNDTFTLPEASLNFIKRHSLMDWSVPSTDNAPIFVKTGLGERLTVISVDSDVKSVDGRTHDVLFVGTTHGRVLKIANSVVGNKKDSEPVLIESLQVFPYHVAVRNILVVHPKTPEPGKLIVLSDHEVNSIPLHRCQAPAAQSCDDCVAMQVSPL
jgi:semaphorin 6